MTWIELQNPIDDGINTYWDLPVSGMFGTVWILIPALPSDVSGSLFVGIGDKVEGKPPIQVDFKLEGMQPYGRVLKFEIPKLTAPVLGLRPEPSEGIDIRPSFQFLPICSQEEIMAFYDTRLDDYQQQVDTELAKRIETVDVIPNHQDYDRGDQFIYSVTGETITLGKNNRWLGDMHEESWSVIAPGLDGLESGGSAALDASAFYDFDGGPERYFERLTLSNATSNTSTFDMVVPGFDDEVAVTEELDRSGSMELDLSKFSFQMNKPEIHVASAGNSRRASLTLTYRNTYQYEPVEVDEPVDADAPEPTA